MRWCLHSLFPTPFPMAGSVKMSLTLSLQVMSEKIWIRLGWNGNSERVVTSIRCTDEQWPSDIDDLKELCRQQLQECTSVGKTQMTVFADDQASEFMDASLEMKEANEKYPTIGKKIKPFVIIMSATGDSFLYDKTLLHLQTLLLKPTLYLRMCVCMIKAM